jgi:dCTP deaminase
MILGKKAIKRALNKGTIRITPNFESHFNSNSYDLTLGKQGLSYKYTTSYPSYYLDSKKDNPTDLFEINDNGIILRPLQGYLLHTVESIYTNKYVPVIDGKSSIGRLFCWIHVTAGFGDRGFNGQYTLEVVSLYPLRLYPGMRIAQVRFHTSTKDDELYNGNYQGPNALGPVSSKSYKQFT